MGEREGDCGKELAMQSGNAAGGERVPYRMAVIQGGGSCIAALCASKKQL